MKIEVIKQGILEDISVGDLLTHNENPYEFCIVLKTSSEQVCLVQLKNYKVSTLPLKSVIGGFTRIVDTDLYYEEFEEDLVTFSSLKKGDLFAAWTVDLNPVSLKLTEHHAWDLAFENISEPSKNFKVRKVKNPTLKIYV